MHSQVCPKYPKQLVCNIFAIPQGKQFLQIDFIILGVCGQACLNYSKLPKLTISLQYHMKEVSDEVDFLHADKHETLLQIDTMILMGMVKYSSSKNSKFAMSLQYLNKIKQK